MNLPLFKMKKAFGIFLIFIFGSICQQLKAQELLTLDQAIQIGLDNNYGIQISQNRAEIANNNLSLGNAGFLPLIDLTVSQTERIEDSEFIAGGEEQSNTDARSSVRNAALNMNWTIFDGLQMFSEYDRLGELKKISDRELRLHMESLAAEIILSFYNIIRISEQVDVLENTLEVSQERIEIEETKFDLGSGSQAELLQAQSDLNADRSALLRENNSLTEAKIYLNELLSRAPGTDFSVSRDIPINRSLMQEELYNLLMAENSELLIARMQLRASEFETRRIRGERYPEISIISGYSYNRNENDGGFIRFNETTGFAVGITARIPIFDGFNTNRRSQNAKINVRNNELELEQSKLRLESDFLALYRSYENNINLVDLEQDNFANAEQTLDIALERFRLGSISSLEFREAQRTFLDAENRLINAKYDAKLAETGLLQLSGQLHALTRD